MMENNVVTYIFIMIPTIIIVLIPLFIVYKIWKWNFLTKTISLIILSLYATIICELGCNVCGLEQDEAYQRVVKDIKIRKLDISKIQFVKNTGSCIYDFKYTDDNQTIDYSILMTWLHGVKTTYNVQKLNTTQ